MCVCSGTFCSFNSRSREGATLKKCVFFFRTPCFNSRSREGATIDSDCPLYSDGVSIHAPVRERPAPSKR